MEVEKTIDDILLIPVLQKGDKLFHYTSASGLKGIMEGEFWVTEHGFLNDATEFQVATDIFCEVVEKHIRNEEFCHWIQDRVREEIARNRNYDLSTNSKFAYNGDYIISFSQDYDSPLMWSSYSDYTGYCIQLDFGKIVDLFEKKYDIFFLHGKVVYDHDEQIHCIEESIRRSNRDWYEEYNHLDDWTDLEKQSTENLKRWCMYVSMIITAYNMFFKYPCFEGENEYRFVFMANHHSGILKSETLWKQYFRIKDEVLIPYIKVPLDSLEPVEKVLVGSKNKSDLAVKGLQCFFRNLKHDIEIEKSEVPLRY